MNKRKVKYIFDDLGEVYTAVETYVSRNVPSLSRKITVPIFLAGVRWLQEKLNKE